MNIVIWTSSYYPAIGGLQTVTLQLAHGLTKNGHNVLVLTNRFPRRFKKREILNGVEIRRVLHANPYILGYIGVLHKLWFRISKIMIKRIIDDHNPDLISLHFPDAQIPYLGFFDFAPYKVITSFHGHDLLRYFEEGVNFNYAYQKIKKWDKQKFRDLRDFLYHCPNATACSNWLNDMVLRLFPDISCKTVYNGVDLNIAELTVQQGGGDRWILSFGRFDTCKGFHFLISEYAKCSAASNHGLLPLRIYGTGPQKMELENLINENNLVRKVMLFDALPHHEMIEKIGESTLVIIPSLRETFGIVALESLAYGKDVWCSNRGGLPEAGGVLVEYFSPDVGELAKKLHHFHEIGGSWTSDSQKIRKAYLNNFSIPVLISSYEKIFRRL